MIYAYAGVGGVGKTYTAMTLATSRGIPFYQEPLKVEGDAGILLPVRDHERHYVPAYTRFFTAVLEAHEKLEDVVIDCSPLQSAAWCIYNEGLDAPNVEVFLALQEWFDKAGCRIGHMKSEETAHKPTAQLIEELVNERYERLSD